MNSDMPCSDTVDHGEEIAAITKPADNNSAPGV